MMKGTAMNQIGSVSDLIKMIEDNTNVYPSSKFLYRGESKTDYRLLPSLLRKTVINGKEKELYQNSELQILQEFAAEASSYLPNIEKNIFECMEYAQHYGVPTRLLDWTSNPLIALYFACQTNRDSDGQLYFLNQTAYETMTFENINQTLKEQIIGILYRKQGFQYPKIFHPYYIDTRMKAQESQFMAWGSQQEDLEKLISSINVLPMVDHVWISGSMKSYGSEAIVPLEKVIIPNYKKKSLLRQLDGLSINRASVFPGLDGIGQSIAYRNNIHNIDRWYDLQIE